MNKEVYTNSNISFQNLLVAHHLLLFFMSNKKVVFSITTLQELQHLCRGAAKDTTLKQRTAVAPEKTDKSKVWIRDEKRELS